jgi:hypothetical protein
MDLTVVAWVAGSLAALYALHHGALWMERRGWIFYRDTKASSTSRSNAFMQVQAMFEPRAEYVVEGRRSDETKAAEEADPGGPSKI